MREIWVVVVLAIAACGRIDFDAEGSAGPTPLAWWKLDEASGMVAHDSAGTLDGSWEGTGLAWEPSGGKVGGALSFPVVDAIVNLGMPAELANLPALTVVAWIHPSSTVVDGNTHCFVDHGDATSGWSLEHGLDAAGDLGFTAFFSAGGSVRVSTPPGLIVPGAWARVAATWDGGSLAAGAHLYLDGHETAYSDRTDATGSRLDDSQVVVGLGCNSSLPYVGLLDDVRIYDRVLTAAEIAAL